MVAVTVFLVIAALIAAFVGTALATDRPQFCPTCHEMKPYFDAWAAGPHNETWCIDCHVEPGMTARFAHKFVALQEVYSHVIGNTSFPRAVPPVVPDARCLSCHPSVPASIDGFPHAAHAEKGYCAQCHYNTGHDVTDEALQAAGVFDPAATPQRLGGELATVGSGKANLAGHKAVSCSKCHDMQATPCASCHSPRGDEHPKVGKVACTECHPTDGGSWAFAHPNVKGDCAECHKAPAKHPAGACEACHKNSGRSWSFAHPRAGEHSYRSFPCKKCHPSTYDKVYCTCHKGRPPRD